jgi:chemotaxis protein MotB
MRKRPQKFSYHESLNKGVPMRKVTIIVLCLLLAAAIISGIIIYKQYSNSRNALMAAEKEVSALTGKVNQLNQEKAVFEDRIRDAAERFEALKKVESELETRDALAKDLRAQWAGALSQVAALRQEVAKGVKEIEGLRGQLLELGKENPEKERSLVDLRQKVQRSERESEGNRKIIADLRNELSSKEGLISKLEGRLSGLAGKEFQLKTELSELKTAHDTMISSLRAQIQNKEVTISELREKLSITFVDRVLFDSGSATITQEGRGILAKVGEILKGVKGKKIRVIGHTDDRPIAAEYHYKFPSNWELSSSRAASVVRFFQKEISLLPEEMEAVGRSFYAPVASNETQEGRALNRRVNIIIAPRAE